MTPLSLLGFVQDGNIKCSWLIFRNITLRSTRYLLLFIIVLLLLSYFPYVLTNMNILCLAVNSLHILTLTKTNGKVKADLSQTGLIICYLSN